ncbi:MAG: HAMP domain-containing sensor histidine kinase [Bacteroidota bacterium]
MELYRKLSKVGFLKSSYAYKFLFVTFIGIHIPLIGLLFFVLFGKEYASTNSIVVFILLMTLLATGITLLILKKLIKPIEIASEALDEYRINRTVPELPITFKDEAGLLLKNIQKSISENEAYRIDKQDLVYLLSHDLRNFTSTSQSLAKLILEEKSTEEITEYADLIYQTTHQQFDFIETFIKLIRDEDEISKKNPTINNIQLHTILNLVEDQVAQKLVSKNIKLTTIVNVNVINLKIEEDLLIRVLVNLADNAIKFSHPNSEIKIDVGIKKRQLVFTICDSGIGFEPKYNEELFKKFTNRSRLGTAKEPSTGIGLYLCKKIVEKHEGKIEAESKGINHGATFSIFFENIN